MKGLYKLSLFALAICLTAATALGQTTKYWQGTTSSWNETTNWSPGGVPGASDVVEIVGGYTNPNLDVDATVSSVQVDWGATLNFNSAGKTLTVSGEFHVNGGGNVQFGANATLEVRGKFYYGGSSFIAANGTVIMNGSGAQVLETYANPTTFNNLTISNGAYVGLSSTGSGNVTVNGVLDLSGGQLILSTWNLIIGSAGSITGASSSYYVFTEGSAVLTRNGVGTTPVDFPVGTGTSYNPVTISNSGTSQAFSVFVKSSFDYTPNNSNVVNDQWTIAPGATDAIATITLQWNTADETGTYSGFSHSNPSDVYIGRWDGSQWVQTSATLGGDGPYTATASGFTSFSAFAVGNNGALPIQMASFAANVVRDNQVEVAWKTASETNNYGFEIYRKRGDASEWAKIAFVQGHGTTLAPQSYTYVDAGLSFGRYYYRIKQVDLDGKSETFPEMSVTVGVAPDKIVLAQNYPNPFNPSTVIDFVVPTSGFATMKVYNVLGQEVASLFEGNADAGRIYTARFTASNLPSGLYFYTLRSAGKVETKRMILMK
jgi:hypothetical protein